VVHSFQAVSALPSHRANQYRSNPSFQRGAFSGPLNSVVRHDMSSVDEILAAFESHSVQRIRAILDAGFDALAPINGKSPVNHLIEMYFRSDNFPACLRLLLERGAVLDDPKIASVLLNDPGAIETSVRADSTFLNHRTNLTCTFTPLVGASLLHVAAEYGNIAAVAKLIELGSDVNARAALDDFGLNGHTPLFHTVNSNANRSVSVMRLLLAAGARADLRLTGITWGKGFEWETTCLDVTPVSYAQLGLLPQFQRLEEDCYANVVELLRASGRTVPPLNNVPNRYLAQ
jgi:ankyrin repeat protein